MSNLSSQFRDLRIDFLRGIALLVIYSDHIQGNAIAAYTPMAVGFSDMAEVFVFLSGYGCGISYGSRFSERGFLSCLKRGWSRAIQVFGAKLFITLVSLLIIMALEKWVTARFFGIPWSMEQVRRYPLETVFEVETFRLELYQYCVLVLYILLLVALPVVVLGLYLRPRLTIATSAFLYWMAQCYPQTTALPRPWSEAMYFNPFAWQFLFFSATALAMLKPEMRLQVRPTWPFTWLSIIVIATAVIIRWKFGSSPIRWTGKANLEWVRIVHFVAVVIIGWRLMPSSVALSRIWICQPLIISGRYSLIGYCTIGVLGILGEAAFNAFTRDWPMQIVVNVTGWTGCLFVSGIWSKQWRREIVLNSSGCNCV